MEDCAMKTHNQHQYLLFQGLNALKLSQMVCAWILIVSAQILSLTVLWGEVIYKRHQSSRHRKESNQFNYIRFTACYLQEKVKVKIKNSVKN